MWVHSSCCTRFLLNFLSEGGKLLNTSTDYGFWFYTLLVIDAACSRLRHTHHLNVSRQHSCVSSHHCLSVNQMVYRRDLGVMDFGERLGIGLGWERNALHCSELSEQWRSGPELIDQRSVCSQCVRDPLSLPDTFIHIPDTLRHALLNVLNLHHQQSTVRGSRRKLAKNENPGANTVDGSFLSTCLI